MSNLNLDKLLIKRALLDADRLTYTPDIGELVYCVETELLYIGDGSTVGGNLTINKTNIGLGNVDNTADINKPLSTDMINALSFKANVNDLANVATSGDYDDLSNKPNIPAAQVPSDWNASSGVAEILNKPTLGTAAAQNVEAFATAAQGTLAEGALQRTGGTVTGPLVIHGDGATAPVTINDPMDEAQILGPAIYSKGQLVAQMNGNNGNFNIVDLVKNHAFLVRGQLQFIGVAGTPVLELINVTFSGNPDWGGARFQRLFASRIGSHTIRRDNRFPYTDVLVGWLS